MSHHSWLDDPDRRYEARIQFDYSTALLHTYNPAGMAYLTSTTQSYCALVVAFTSDRSADRQGEVMGLVGLVHSLSMRAMRANLIRILYHLTSPDFLFGMNYIGSYLSACCGPGPGSRAGPLPHFTLRRRVQHGTTTSQSQNATLHSFSALM